MTHAQTLRWLARASCAYYVVPPKRRGVKRTKREAHRRHAQKLDIFPEIWHDPDNDDGGSQIPWHLTKTQIDLLELRMSRIMWPHYMERLYYRGASPWKKPGRSWKARRKYRLLWFLLPVQLRDRDMVPALREALVLMAWAIRRLQGLFCVFNLMVCILIIFATLICHTFPTLTRTSLLL